MNRCFACDRKLGKNPHSADTRDDQHVMVGSECYKKILAAGEVGWEIPAEQNDGIRGFRLWELQDPSYRITGGQI